MTTIDPELVAQAEATIEHFNANHADTVLFVARHLTATPGLVDAEFGDFDPSGLVLNVVDGDGPRVVRVDFESTITSIGDMQVHLRGHLVAARAADPDGALTSMEREQARQGSIPTRVVDVVAFEDLAPNLRQITIGGLGDHEPLGPDDFFLVMLPKEGLDHQLDGTHDFAYFMALPDDEKPAWAYYTCRRFRPEVGEMDLWFVLHDHEGAVSSWARRVQVGDRAGLWGPREGFEPPADTTAYLLVGDETGLGAFAAILDSADGGVPVHAVVESDDGKPVIDLPARPKDTVQWVSRDGADHGRGSALLDAVSALTLDTNGLYAYGAAESREITAVRKHLRHVVGMAATQVEMIGYWRRND